MQRAGRRFAVEASHPGSARSRRRDPVATESRVAAIALPVAVRDPSIPPRAAPSTHRRLPTLLASAAVHAALTALAVWQIGRSAEEFPRGGDHSIPVEVIIEGAREQSASSEGAAASVDPRDDPAEPAAPPVTPAEEVPPPPLEQAFPASVGPVAPEIATEVPFPAEVPLSTELPLSAEAEARPDSPPEPPAPAPVRSEPKATRSRPTATAPVRPLRDGKGRGADAAERQAAAPGGTGGATASAGTAEMTSYRARVMAHLARHKSYPDGARDRGVSGRATVSFTLERSGAVLAVSLAASSTIDSLDQATLAMVRRAAPFPAMPDGAPNGMTFTAVIRYDLR